MPKINIVNRSEYPVFQRSYIPKFKTKKKITSVKPVMVSHKAKYKEAKKKGMAIDITNPEIYIANGKKPIDGIFSPAFGADTTQDVPIYSCDCHALTGAINMDKLCPDCKTRVRSIEADLRLCGYIDIAPYHILTYHGYNAFSKILKETSLKDILANVGKIDHRGKFVDEGKPTLIKLYNEYESRYKDTIGLDIDYVFTDKIPVYSARLRPLMRFGSKMPMLEDNKLYMSMVRLRNILTTGYVIPMDRDSEVHRTLNHLQNDFINLCKLIEQQIDKKSGVYRKTLASGRIDYSSRMVIATGIDLMTHEVDVPYSMMLTVYEEEIAAQLSKVKGISITKALEYIDEHITYRDEYLVSIINQVLRKGNGIWALVNRNPTISESGILYMRIRKIHDDPHDFTLHLPPDILGLIAADYDGDQCTEAAVKNPIFHDLYIIMCPVYAFIDRANGRFNKAMGFSRDYGAILSQAWTIDRALNKYLNSPEEDAYDTLMSVGVDIHDDNPEDSLAAIIESVPEDHPIRKRFMKLLK